MSRWQILSVTPQGPSPTSLPDFPAPTVLVFPADADGEALAGATAALCGAKVLGRIVSLLRTDSGVVATRASHGGRILIEVQQSHGIAVATANVMPECDDSIFLGQTADIGVQRTAKSDNHVALESAQLVFGGGRGLDEECFAQLDQLAAATAGAVGASLPAVDLGLAPVSRQVGQSGKFITPRAYLAIGMSGTPQHLAGIGSATRLIAINTDPEAAIFRFAEAGVIADAKALLPLLTNAMKRKLGEIA